MQQLVLHNKCLGVGLLKPFGLLVMPPGYEMHCSSDVSVVESDAADPG